MSSTSSTSGSNFKSLICRCKSTGPGVVSQVGIDCPLVDCRWKENMLLCGVAFFEVHSRDLIVCRASHMPSCHHVTSS